MPRIWSKIKDIDHLKEIINEGLEKHRVKYKGDIPDSGYIEDISKQIKLQADNTSDGSEQYKLNKFLQFIEAKYLGHEDKPKMGEPLPSHLKVNSPKLTLERLDRDQFALLFHYLETNGAILHHTSEDLATLAHYLSGHSQKNLRTEAFGKIRDILKSENNVKKPLNTDLEVLKTLLLAIVGQVEDQIQTNREVKSR